ncbi:hypothetical protein TWF694_003806 [Orbilia ellipsospora]|uniref:Uncharacterized protein n=1 Tax=Orbilia ellipsospora TaxID=2528407 RepID=A0AAV9WZB3_9PEZI
MDLVTPATRDLLVEFYQDINDWHDRSCRIAENISNSSSTSRTMDLRSTDSRIRASGQATETIISRFERLPGEIRNEIYAYLFDPVRNTSFERSPTNPYKFRGLPPTKTGNEPDDSDNDDDVELVVYAKGNAVPKLQRMRIYHDILRTNRKIYREAHGFLYTISAPVLKVRGLPFNTPLCRLMERMGFRWFFTSDVGDTRIDGSAGTLDIKWKDNEEPDDDQCGVYRREECHPDIVLVGSQIAEFVKWLQVLKIKDTAHRELFILNFNFHESANIFGEALMDDTQNSRNRWKIINDFRDFKGTGIFYGSVSGFDAAYANKVLKFLNQPIMWIRAEILRIVDLSRSIAKQGGPVKDDADLIDNFCRWIFIGDLVRNKIESSYEHLVHFYPRMDDLYPILTLKQVFQIGFYNFAKSLFLMIVKDILPDALGLRDPLETLRDICDDLDELTEQTMEVKHGEGNGRVLVLSPYQISRVEHLQAMICIYCQKRGTLNKGVQYFESCVAHADGERKRMLGFLMEAVATWREDGDTEKITEELMEYLIHVFPEGDLEISMPMQMKSSRIEYERRILKRYGYVEDSLADRFVQNPPEKTGSKLEPPDIAIDWEFYRSSRTARKVWLGTGMEDLFVVDQ